MPKHKITKISAQKNTERLNIYLDEVFGLGINHNLLAEYDLFVGKELSDKEIKQIEKSDELKKCLDKAYRYLSYRPRSQKEVTDKLLEKYDSKTVNKALHKLTDLGYVNDLSFANFWIENRSASRGATLLRMELRNKGISKEIIEATLSELDDDKQLEAAIALVRSKRKYQGLGKDEYYKKVAPFLARRGYNYSVIKDVIKVLNKNK